MNRTLGRDIMSVQAPRAKGQDRTNRSGKAWRVGFQILLEATLEKTSEIESLLDVEAMSARSYHGDGGILCRGRVRISSIWGWCFQEERSATVPRCIFTAGKGIRVWTMMSDTKLETFVCLSCRGMYKEALPCLQRGPRRGRSDSFRSGIIFLDSGSGLLGILLLPPVALQLEVMS